VSSHHPGEQEVDELRRSLERVQRANAELVLAVETSRRENERVTAQLRALVQDLSEKQELLESQNEELLSQAEEIQVQNDELFEHQRELERKNAQIEQANQELARLFELSQQQEARMRAIVDSTADGIMVVDGEHRVFTVNPALELLIGYYAEDLVGRTCKYLLDAHKGDGGYICESACPFLHPMGVGPSGVDATVTTRDGQQVWVNVAYGPIYGADGRVTAVVHAIRDISARKEVERLKDEFLGMVAHDLRTPLTSIR